MCQEIFAFSRTETHTSKIVQKWISDNVPHTLSSLPQNPDLNLIEHLWEELDRRLKRNNITSKGSLKQNILAAWHSMDSSVAKKLVNSIELKPRPNIYCILS